MLCVIPARWSVAVPVYAGTLTLSGGVSQGKLLNMAFHVQDQAENVLENRRRFAIHLQEKTHSQAHFYWLQQVHSTKVIDAGDYTAGICADACIVRKKGDVAVVMTADCLPILLTDTKANVCAAVHAGWRGIADNIIMHSIEKISCSPAGLHAWIGPAISAEHYQVDEDFYQRFLALDHRYKDLFYPQSNGHYLADLKQMALLQLLECGLMRKNIHVDSHCTYSARDLPSYRRDGEQSFRMATFITPIA